MKKLIGMVMGLAAGAAWAYDASSYVQDGLIAQWDGVDNTALGYHDCNVSVWKDRMGTYDLTLTEFGEWGANYLNVLGRCAAKFGALACDKACTIEYLFRKPATSSKDSIVFLSGNNTRMLLVSADAKTVWFNGRNNDYCIKYADCEGDIRSVAATYAKDTDTQLSCAYSNGVACTATKVSNGYNNGDGKLMIGDRSVSSSNYGFPGEVYSIRVYSTELTPEQIAHNYKVDAARYLGIVSNDTLEVSGYPCNVPAAVSPSYAAGREGLSAGDTVSVSAPAEELAVKDGFTARCVGWKLYDEQGTVVDHGDTLSFTYTHPTPAAYRRLEWQFETAVRITVSGAGGTYQPAEQYVPYGSKAKIKVVPDEGKALALVTNDINDETWATPEFEVTVAAPMNFTATYNNAYYVSMDGNDANDGKTRAHAKASINEAVKAASDGDSVVVLEGDYLNPGLIDIAKAVTVYGEAGRDKTTVFHTAATKVVNLNKAKAVVRGLTFYSDKAASTGSQVVSVTAGLFEDCVVRDFYSGGSTVYVKGANSCARNCIVSGNKNAARCESGIELADNSLVENCTIVGNEGDNNTYGCALYLWNGTARNCLVACNTNKSSNVAGAYVNSSSTLENCTVVDNVVLASGTAAGIHLASGKVRNCLAWGNVNTAGVLDWYGAASGYSSCCLSPLPSATGGHVLAVEPDFADRAHGDYRLKSGPALDAGADQNWMLTATDLAGLDRIVGAASDIGCYEADAKAFAVSGLAPFAKSFGEQEVELRAFAAGTNTTGVSYTWTVRDSTGAVAWTTTTAEPVVSHEFGYGQFTIELEATNAAGETARWTAPAAFSILSTTVYVATNSTPVYPFATKATAANDINTALQAAVDGSTVVVCDGTYACDDPISVMSALTIRGEHGATNTTLVCNKAIALFTINNTAARVEGLTLMSDGTKRSVRAATINSGVLADCDVHGFNSTETLFWMNSTDSVISNCFVHGNLVEGRKMVIDMEPGGKVLNSRIVGNAGSNNTYGGAVWGYSGTCLVRNCLIACNTNRDSSASAVYACSGMTVENCTIVGNYVANSTSKAGVVAVAGSVFRNCIIHDNRNKGGVQNWEGEGSVFSHCCTTPIPVADKGNFVPVEPMFADDWHLPSGVCVNTGDNQTWMNPPATDLDGKERILEDIVDLGCFEYKPGALECSVTPSPVFLIGRGEVTLTATVGGADKEGLTYSWTVLNERGETVLEREGVQDASVAEVFDYGSYTVRLVVENAAHVTAEFEKEGLFQVKPVNVYVAPSASETFPYDTKENAFTNLAAALAFAEIGMHVVLTDGVYTNANGLSVGKAVTVESENGPTKTTVFTPTSVKDAWTLNAEGCMVRGLTIASDNKDVYGCGRAFDILNGTVDSCVITNFFVRYYDGVIMFRSGAGTMSNCLVTGCTTKQRTYFVYLATEATVENCRFVNNVCDADSNAYGSFFRFDTNGKDTVVRNCLIADNDIGLTCDAGIFYFYGSGGRVENCTIVHNRVTRSATAPMVLFNGSVSGSVVNTIFWDNENTAGALDFNSDSESHFSHCCTTTPGLAGEQGFSADPRLRADCRLRVSSPCLDKGTPLGWMTSDATDLYGRPRVVNRLPDIGCCENPQSGVMILVK